MLKKSVVITYNDYALSAVIAEQLKGKLIRAEFAVHHHFVGDEALIFTIGGDGSFIKTIHDFNFPSIPIVGINTGHLGFFQEILPEQLDLFIENYQKQNYTLQEILPLQATVYIADKRFIIKSLNEIVLRSYLGKTVHLNLSINGNFIQCFGGDGLIISSSAGSTAYNYSAGGSIVDPSINTLQITPLAPLNTNAYRSFTSSIISSSTSDIIVSPEEQYRNYISIIVDGVQKHYNDFKEIVVTTHTDPIRVIRMDNYEFWNKVTNKFL